jgi:hypothetical protein
MKSRLLILLTIFFLLLSACSNQNPTSVPPSPTIEQPNIPTSTPDPCSVENLSESIKNVNDLMREFDDMSKLAANLSREKLPELISEMQRVRRAAEDQKVPACLSTLRIHQISHMNIVIDTLIAFLGGAQPETLNDGIARAGQAHDLYTMEVARLLGIPQDLTLTPAVTTSP